MTRVSVATAVVGANLAFFGRLGNSRFRFFPCHALDRAGYVQYGLDLTNGRAKLPGCHQVCLQMGDTVDSQRCADRNQLADERFLRAIRGIRPRRVSELLFGQASHARCRAATA